MRSGVERWQRQVLGQGQGFFARYLFSDSPATIDSVVPVKGQDFTTCSTAGGVRPRAELLMEIEEPGQNLFEIGPVRAVIGLHAESPIPFKNAMNLRHKGRPK